MSSLTMQVSCTDTAMGESVAIVGSWSNWKIPTLMSTTAQAFPKWSGKLNVNVCKGGEYKYVIITKDGRVGRWEDGDNRHVENKFSMVDDGAFGDGGGNRRKIAVVQEAAKANGDAKKSQCTPPVNGKQCNGAAKPQQKAKQSTSPPNGSPKPKQSPAGARNGKPIGKAPKVPVEKENKAPVSISISAPAAKKQVVAGDTTAKVVAEAEKVQGDTLTESTKNNEAPATQSNATATKSQAGGAKRKSKK